MAKSRISVQIFKIAVRLGPAWPHALRAELTWRRQELEDRLNPAVSTGSLAPDQWIQHSAREFDLRH